MTIDSLFGEKLTRGRPDWGHVVVGCNWFSGYRSNQFPPSLNNRKEEEEEEEEEEEVEGNDLQRLVKEIKKKNKKKRRSSGVTALFEKRQRC